MKRNIFAVLLFIGLFGFSACNLEKKEKGFIFDEKEFNAQWDKWRDNDIQNYSFTMTGALPHWNFRAILMYEYKVKNNV